MVASAGRIRFVIMTTVPRREPEPVPTESSRSSAAERFKDGLFAVRVFVENVLLIGLFFGAVGFIGYTLWEVVVRRE